MLKMQQQSMPMREGRCLPPRGRLFGEFPRGLAQPLQLRASPSPAVAGRSAAPSSVAAKGLTPEQVHQFHRDGYLVIENHATREEVTALRKRAAELLESCDPKEVTFFLTENQAKDTNRYYMDSANNISFFFEDRAFDEGGELRQAKNLSIKKIAHALHNIDPVFRSFSRSPKVNAVLRSLGYKRPQPVQSQYIFKQPIIGTPSPPHQDSTYLTSAPLSCLALWWAMEDATEQNGCLWAIPGIHKQGQFQRMMIKDGLITYDRPLPNYDVSAGVPLECGAGALVLLHGENVHWSPANTSPVSRHSYNMHVSESCQGYTWLPDNWTQPKPGESWEPIYDDE